MGKFMRVLERAGLVTLAESEAGERLPDVELAADPERSPPPMETSMSESEAVIEEQQSLSTIYAAHGVVASPFPAEKLLRVIDGLKALDPATCKAAIAAMDAADDAWSINDPVLDAQRKVQALNAQAAHLVAQADASKRIAAQKIAAAEQRRQQSSAVISQQIAELEQLLARESGKAATEKAQLEAAVQVAEAACQRETQRLQSEAERLSGLISSFTQS